MDIRSTGSIPQFGTSAAKEPAQFAPAETAAKAVGPTQTTAAVPEPPSLPSAAQIKEALKEINDALRAQSPDIEFTVDEDSKRTIIKVVDQKTNEVIRQMPTKEALEIAKALDRMQGLLLRQKA